MVKATFEVVDFASIRDGGVSQQVLQSIGLNEEKLVSVGDEAFILPLADENEVNTYLRTQDVDINKPLAVFHFRSKDYTQSTTKYYTDLAKAFDHVNLDRQILFLPMSYSNIQVWITYVAKLYRH